MQNLATKSYPSLLNNLMSRAEVETNSNSWDHVQRISLKVRSFIMEITDKVMQGRDFLTNMNSFTGESVVLINSILKDIENTAKSWQALAVTHVGLTGIGKNAEEFSKITDIGLSYIQLHEEFMLASSRVVARLQEIIIEKEHEYNLSKNQEINQAI